MATETLTGGCHCGKVRFEADLDLSRGTGRCNCSICAKLRHWGALAKPADVRLKSGAGDLSTYEWGHKISKRYFCKHCGVHTHAFGHLAEIGGDFAGINVACLDLPPERLGQLAVRYYDGLNNRWDEPPAVTSYL